MKKVHLIIPFLLFVNAVFANNGFLQNLQNTSSNNNKTLLIFYREDCPYCANMDKIISADANFQKQLLEKYNVKLLDIKSEEGRLMADKFNVHAVPTLVNFDNTTGESKIIKGFGGIEKLSNTLGLPFTKPLSQKKEIYITNKNIFATCGNGIVEAGESCDDGNITNGDGCSSTCNVQPGFSCVGSPSVCTAICGDGLIAGAETCDDGNTTNGDGCTSTCNVQAGYTCIGQPSVCTPITICGDGIVAGTESCDDGNTTSGDGCTSTCSVESGFVCVGSPSVCSVICGDGVIGPGEQCDDGNTTNGDGCNSTCQFEVPANNECSGALVLFGTSGTQNGNNVAATNSVGVPVPTCQSLIAKDVWYSFTLATPKLCRFEVNGPTISDPVLVIYSGTCAALTQVACDDDAGPGTYSLIQTSLNAGTYFVRIGSYNTSVTGTFSLVYNLNLSNICGNSIIESTEECDDGNVTNGDGCSSICKIENAATIKGVAINTDTTRANPSAMLDVKSFDRGVLIPRMSTTQRTAIANPAKGLLVFDITTNTFWYNIGGTWKEVGGTSGVAGGGLPTATTGQTLQFNGTNWIASTNAAFFVRADSNRTLINAAAAIRLHFGTVGNNTYNIGSAYNTATDEFVVPVSGLYSFTLDLSVSDNAVPSLFSIYAIIKINSSSNVLLQTHNFRDIVTPGVQSPNFSHTIVLNLNAGEKVFVESQKNSGGGTSNITINGGGGTPTTTFSGYKIN
jgi:cysteine-rich repeat protein